MSGFFSRKNAHHHEAIEMRVNQLELDLHRVHEISARTEEQNNALIEMIRELRAVVIQLDSSKSEMLTMRLDDLWKKIGDDFAGQVVHLDLNFRGVTEHIDQLFTRINALETMLNELRDVVIRLDLNKTNLITEHFSGLVDSVSISVTARLETQLEMLRADMADARQQIVSKLD